MKTCYLFLRKKLWQKSILPRLYQDDFTIISDDCWAGEIYRKLGIEYKTPCVGLIIKAPCYIRMLEKFDDIIKSPLRFSDSSRYNNLPDIKYPIGILDDQIEIHFYHYKHKNDAERKWNRRVRRINHNKLLFKIDAEKTRREFPEAYPQIMERFEQLPGDKIIIDCGTKQLCPHQVPVKHWGEDGRLMLKKSLLYFDLAHWLNTGEVINTLKNKLIYYLLLAPRTRKG